ncbi:MAG: undecaprenyl-diphosphate phosphatase [Actinomycetia bacterium]|nr:undecaprenyl-diphosphate phosphatase [Actinomycetes bacterium]
MNILQSIILGIIQGITEFFPISSSGHLVIAPLLFGWDYPPLYFTVTVHFATLLAVITVFYRDIKGIIKAVVQGPFKKKCRETYDFKIGLLIIIATIPAALAGYFLDDLFESFFSNPPAVAGFMLFTAFILWGSEMIGKRAVQKTEFGFLSALTVGIGQALAIFPGISRSGTTISFARLFGIKREEAVRFSFLLSIPIILGSFLFEISRSAGEVFGGGSGVLWSLITGFIAAYIAGYFAIKYLLYLVRRKNLNIFALYCICLSAAIFIFYIIKNNI